MNTTTYTGTSLSSVVNGNICAGILVKYNNGNLYEDRGSSEWVDAYENCKHALRGRTGLKKINTGQLVAATNLCIGNIHGLTNNDWSMIANYIAQRI